MSPKFLPYLCGFTKNHSSQHSLLKMIEIWKQHLDKSNLVDVLLMDLPKAFDTINYSLLLAKLKEAGFSANPLKLLQSYLSNRFRRTHMVHSVI